MDKQKQIEEMAYIICEMAMKPKTCAECAGRKGGCFSIPKMERLYNAGYRKIHEGAVVLTEKEYRRYERIEKTIKLAKREKAIGYEVKNGKLYYFSNLLEGFECEFKDLQEVCEMANHYLEEFYGLDQRLTFWKGKAETTEQETAEKFAGRLKDEYLPIISGYFSDSETEKEQELNRLLCEMTDEILKEIKEGKL